MHKTFDISGDWQKGGPLHATRWPAVVLQIGGNLFWRRMYADETLSSIAQETAQPGMPAFTVARFPDKAASLSLKPASYLVRSLGSVRLSDDGAIHTS